MDSKRLKDLLGSAVPPKSLTMRSVSVEHGDDAGSDEPDERVLSAKAIIRAVRSNDPEALDMALEDHYRACEGSKEPDDDESDDSDPGLSEYGTD